jgi:hypothetical protein
MNKKRKQFFSEEKNQKTFALGAIPHVASMPRIYMPAWGKSLLVLCFGKELLSSFFHQLK